MLTYGITPPKARHTSDKIQEIADKQLDRLRKLDMDALIIYDIQDESDRITDERPYPFLPTVDPKTYADDFLNALDVPKILFRAVGNYSPEQLESEFRNAPQGQRYVLVGASSGAQKVQISLPEAFELCRKVNPQVALGGIMIPERHQKKNDEHLRVRDKVAQGCSFFISQAVYHAEASKNFLSDHYYLCEHTGKEMKPVLFTLTLCGSPKTLDFLKWLGVSIPNWVRNELLNSKDILQRSFDISYQIYEELNEFAREKGIPVGFNIESVAIRKEEIDASLELFEKVKKNYDLGKIKGAKSWALNSF